ncbi:hypothetical protein [Mucilaginibacter aquaedulcis]|uniref:hypothetical protein n=1 Tax=Mucilaginibacter aquaedulcis TaxID=1187081 RepID=UPI0025B61C41|nr:hypothetical protein [Mucilaginibacter aquaedulcis]MDN3551605.1 hypothetical protein [Mucilaginibacter aquaedulcis]
MATKVYQDGFRPRPVKWEEEKQQLKIDLKAVAKNFVVTQLKTEIYDSYGILLRQSVSN